MIGDSDGSDSSDELEDNINNNDNIPYKYLRCLLNSNTFNETMNANIVLSTFEILLGILKIGEKHDKCHKRHLSWSEI